MGLGNERASLVILWDIVHAMAMATTKVDEELVRFQSGWASGSISTGTVATR